MGAGFGMGFLVAAQVGPIWLLCARSVLRGRCRTGLAIGAGAALVDAAYASLGALGATQLLRIDALRLVLGLAGAAFIAYLGLRTLWTAMRVRAGFETAAEIASTGAALRTSLLATASNPLTIASWAAIFSAASAASLTGSVLWMTVGVGLGSITWFSVLSVGMSVLRPRVTTRGLRLADGAAGLGLVGFGGLMAWRTLRSV